MHVHFSVFETGSLYEASAVLEPCCADLACLCFLSAGIEVMPTMPVNVSGIFLLGFLRQGFSVALDPVRPGTHSVDQAGHKLTEIYLPLPPECWD